MLEFEKFCLIGSVVVGAAIIRQIIVSTAAELLSPAGYKTVFNTCGYSTVVSIVILSCYIRLQVNKKSILFKKSTFAEFNVQ